MIRVTRFDGSELIINAELIEFVESTPDTVLTMTTGRKIVVTESASDVIASVVDYKRRIFANFIAGQEN